MRRTTICRSSATLVAALVSVGLNTAPARAQNPPPPAGQTPAPSATPSTPLSAPPASHTVQQGETLWSLAQQYFGDPLLWPEIYRLNTDVVEDPHWIFPGEELRLQALAGPVVSGDPPPTTPSVITISPTGDTVRRPLAPIAVDQPTTIFSPTNRPAVETTDLEVAAARAYRAVREGEYYSAAFLTENRPLPTGRLLGNQQSSSIRRLSTASSANLFTVVAVEPSTNDTIGPGDLLLALRRDGEVRGYGDVMRPTGLLRVTGVSPNRALATVVAMYGSVRDGQEVLRVAPYRMDSSIRPVEVENGVTGVVIGLVNSSDVVTLQNGLFLDKGAEDGVRLGDLFTISGTDRTRNDFEGVVTEQAQVMVVSVRPHTSTAIIIQLSRPDVRIGSAARQVRRMPS